MVSAHLDEGGAHAMGALDGKVVFITGGARGQGRSHAVHFAEEGADVIIADLLEDIETVTRSGSTQEDLDETIALVEKTGRQVFARKADVRDFAALNAVVNDGVAEFGRLDFCLANAGIMAQPAFLWEYTEEQWKTTIDINLTGVFHAIKATVPHIIDGDKGGALVLTSSVAGVKGYPTYGNYVAAKHGVIGLMKTLAQELGPKNIRVNAILPSTVNTPMVQYKEFWQAIRPDLADPTADDAKEWYDQSVLLPGAGMLEPFDISEAAVWLCSNRARFVTGVDLRVDAGFYIK
jgi:SDR family mycofactocin-dependent oxidoreductase